MAVKVEHRLPVSLLTGVAISLLLYGLFLILSAGQNPGEWKATAASILWLLLGPHIAVGSMDFWLLPNILIFASLSYLALFGSPIR